MALNGVVNSSAYDSRYISLSWSAEQNKETNQSKISWTLKGAGGSSNTWYMSGNFKVTINGNQEYFNSNRIQLYDGTVVATGTKTISHDAQGKAKLNISIEAGIYTVAVNCTGSESWDLNDIPRATQPSLNKTSANIGEKVTITLDRATSSMTHNIAIYYGNKSLTIATGVQTSYTWTIPSSVASWIPNDTSMDVKITAFTFQNGTQIGSKSTNIKIGIPSSAVPSISNVTISEANSDISNFGMFIQNMSKLRVQTSASGIYGSSISSVTSTIENVSYSGADFTTNTIVNSGTLDIKVTVTDGRGRQTSTTKSITIQEYQQPQLLIFNARRADSAGNIKESGTYLRVEYDFKISPVQNKNAKRMVIKYKLATATSYTELFSTEAYEGKSVYLSGSILDLSKSYDIRIELIDSFTTIPSEFKVPTERVPLELMYTGLGVSIGKAAELDETFDVDLYSLFRKNIDFKGMVNFAISPMFNSPLTLINGFTFKPQIINGGSLNTYMLISGVWYVSNASNRPVEASGFLIVYVNGDNSVYQKFITLSGLSYERLKTSSGWSPWCGWFSNNQWKWKTSLSGDFEAYCTANLSGVYNTGNGGGYETSFDASYLLPEGLNIVGEPLVFGNVSHSDSSYGYFRYIEISTLGSGFKAIKFRVGRLASNSNRLTSKLRLSVYGKWK